MEKRKRTPENCIKVKVDNPEQCSECDQPTTNWHHMVPHSEGGNRMWPLCDKCNNLIHDKDLTSMRVLGQEGLRRRVERGEHYRGWESTHDPELISRIVDMYKNGLKAYSIGKHLTADGTWPMPLDLKSSWTMNNKKYPNGYSSSPEATWARRMGSKVTGILKTVQNQRERLARKATYDLKQEVVNTGGTIPIGAWIPDDRPIVRGQNLPNFFNETS